MANVKVFVHANNVDDDTNMDTVDRAITLASSTQLSRLAEKIQRQTNLQCVLCLLQFVHQHTPSVLAVLQVALQVPYGSVHSEGVVVCVLVRRDLLGDDGTVQPRQRPRPDQGTRRDLG